MPNLVLYVKSGDQTKAERLRAAGGDGARAVQVQFSQANQARSYQISNVAEITNAGFLADIVFWIGHGRRGVLSAKDGINSDDNQRIELNNTVVRYASLVGLLNALQARVLTLQGCDIAAQNGNQNGGEQVARALAGCNRLAIINMSTTTTMFSPGAQPNQNRMYWSRIMQDVHAMYRRDHQVFDLSSQSTFTTYRGQALGEICTNGGYNEEGGDFTV